MSIDKKTLEAFPFLADKLVVDVVNGIEVANEHVRIQRQERGFAGRLIGVLSGKDVQRQAEVNASQNEAIAATFTMLTDLCGAVVKGNRAIVQVNERVDHLSEHLKKLAIHSMEIKHQIEELDCIRQNQIYLLQADVKELRLEVKARTQMNLVLSKWDIGLWDSLSLSARCYLVLEELRWGDFGDFLKYGDQSAIDSLVSTLKNMLIARLQKDMDCTRDDRIDTRLWLSPTESSNEFFEALQYTGDWSNALANPYSFSISQLVDELPERMPRLLSAERLVKQVSKEVFHG